MQHISERVCVCFYSPSHSARLRCWTGGGGEKQLDGTNDVTNNTFSHTSSICSKQTGETLAVHPVAADAHFSQHLDEL